MVLLLSNFMKLKRPFLENVEEKRYRIHLLILGLRLDSYQLIVYST